MCHNTPSDGCVLETNFIIYIFKKCLTCHSFPVFLITPFLSTLQRSMWELHHSFLIFKALPRPVFESAYTSTMLLEQYPWAKADMPNNSKFSWKTNFSVLTAGGRS